MWMAPPGGPLFLKEAEGEGILVRWPGDEQAQEEGGVQAESSGRHVVVSGRGIFPDISAAQRAAAAARMSSKSCFIPGCT